MKIYDYRKKNGQFKKKSKAKVVFNWILLIGTAILIVKLFVEPLITSQNAPERTFTTQKDICAGNEKCTLKIENLAKQTLLQDKMDKEKADYEVKMKEYNAQMETLRAEELSF